MNRIDHVIVHVDKSTQNSPTLIESLQKTGLPYNPRKGKRTKGFKVSNLWIGKEYLELVGIIKKDGGGWRKEWVELYNQGHRGAVCLMIDVSDIDALSKAFPKQLVKTQIERIQYKLFGLLKLSPPWRNLFLPYFANEKFQIGFQQLDRADTFAKFEKHMIPNSTAHHIMGMSKIVVKGQWTIADYELLEVTFPHTKREDKQLNIRLNNGSEITFVEDTNLSLQIELDHETNDKGSTQIENVQLTKF